MQRANEQATKRIGELLIERGLINARQLEQALERQRSSGQFLGAILVDMGAVTERALVETVARQFGLPYESLDQARVDWAVARQFPAAVLSTGRGFPIRADNDGITLAIANPLDVWTLSEFERAAGHRVVRPVLVLERELQAVVQVHRRQVLQAMEAKLSEGTDGQAQ